VERNQYLETGQGIALLKLAYRWLWPASATVGGVILLPDFLTDELLCLDARLQLGLTGRVCCVWWVFVSLGKELAPFLERLL